jgi:hypothetical protein
MAKTKISEYDATAGNNTDINSINIDEGCSPSGINNAIRAAMSHLKAFQTGTSGDSLTVGGDLTVTGNATGLTLASSDNSTKFATTAFVTTKIGTLGTISTQNANAVSITGGTIAGTTISGTAVTANSIANTGGWAVTPSSTTLYFSYNGVNVAKLDSSGNLTVKANVTAYGTV